MFFENQKELYCQVCLHIRGICKSDSSLHSTKRMTVTGQDTDNKKIQNRINSKKTIYKIQYTKKSFKRYSNSVYHNSVSKMQDTCLKE